jgi:hypothetical protein
MNRFIKSKVFIAMKNPIVGFVGNDLPTASFLYGFAVHVKCFGNKDLVPCLMIVDK